MDGDRSPQSQVPDAQWQQLLEEQLRHHARLFFRLAVRIVGDPASAEDACQHAFLNVWQQRQVIRQPGRLKSYLAQSVVNASLEMVRRRRTETRVMAQHATMRLHTEQDGIELRESVLVALARLPERHAVTVVLRVMEEMPGIDVAQVLECSPAEVSRMLYAGLEMLRSHLADWQVELRRVERMDEQS